MNTDVYDIETLANQVIRIALRHQNFKSFFEDASIDIFDGIADNSIIDSILYQVAQQIPKFTSEINAYRQELEEEYTTREIELRVELFIDT